MNVSLTPELDKFVAKKVKSGRYTSASEVVREALRLLEAQEQTRAERLAEFKRELDMRIAAADRGETMPGDESFRRTMARSAERRKLRA